MIWSERNEENLSWVESRAELHKRKVQAGRSQWRRETRKKPRVQKRKTRLQIMLERREEDRTQALERVPAALGQ